MDEFSSDNLWQICNSSLFDKVWREENLSFPNILSIIIDKIYILKMILIVTVFEEFDAIDDLFKISNASSWILFHHLR